MKKLKLAILLLVMAYAAKAQVTALTPVPRIQFLDANGKPLAGGLVYTYSAGTTTPLATYTTSAGNVANTNPVVLDSGGFAGIWLSPVAYKITLKSRDGVTQWTVDNVYDWAQILRADLASTATNKGAAMIGYKPQVGLAVARTVQAKLDEIFTIKDFGAVCDNSTDDHVALQAAIDYAVSLQGGAVLEGPSGATCYIGTVGLTIPANAITDGGIEIRGPSWGGFNIRYTGSGAALTAGTAGDTIYHLKLENFGIDITGAGVNAIGLLTHSAIYWRYHNLRITSDNSLGADANQQIGAEFIGGDGLDGTFGAYGDWNNNEVRGLFRTGLKITAGAVGWGFISNTFNGGGIIYPSLSVPTGKTPPYTGVWMVQGNEDMFTGVDVENWDIGWQNDSYDNYFVGIREEGNHTHGFVMTAINLPTSQGGGFARVWSSSIPNGIVDLTGGSSQIWMTNNGNNYENHITNFAYLDTPLTITGNTAITWKGASGGSSGLFWNNGGMSAVDSIFADDVGTIHFQLSGVDYLIINPNETPSRGVEIPVGIYRNSAGFQHFSTSAASTCSTAASAGAQCTQTLTWNTTWADTNYNAICNIGELGTGEPSLAVASKSTTQIVLKITALTAVAANGGVTCIGVHY